MPIGCVTNTCLSLWYLIQHVQNESMTLTTCPLLTWHHFFTATIEICDPWLNNSADGFHNTCQPYKLAV